MPLDQEKLRKKRLRYYNKHRDELLRKKREGHQEKIEHDLLLLTMAGERKTLSFPLDYDVHVIMTEFLKIGHRVLSRGTMQHHCPRCGLNCRTIWSACPKGISVSNLPQYVVTCSFCTSLWLIYHEENAMVFFELPQKYSYLAPNLEEEKQRIMVIPADE